MSRRQEHNMWSEESRGQQRGARGQQFKPEWTVMGTDREGECPEQHHNGEWEEQGGSEEPGNETARSPAQWAKEVHQPVMNDRAGKRETKCWSPLQEEVGCLSGAARRGGLRLQVCARTGCECGRESQHVERRMSRHRKSLR